MILRNDLFTVFYHGVRGAKHELEESECQDSIKIKRDDYDSIKLALADGHGGKIHFRSKKGADFATEIAINIQTEILREPYHIIREILPKNMIYKWREYVENDILEHPLEKDLTYSELNEYYKIKIDRNPYQVYGTTLIALYLLNNRIIFLQIGDGDILVLDKNEVLYKPFPRQSDFIGNETSSLCLPNASYHFLIKIIDFEEISRLPLFIMVATDGYFNSFISKESFENHAMNIFECIKKNMNVEKFLRDELPQISHTGSGDDISVAIVINNSIINNLRDFGGYNGDI